MGTHVTPTQKLSGGSYMRLLTPTGQDMHNRSLYPHTLMDFHGT